MSNEDGNERVPLRELEALAADALAASDTATDTAGCVAQALVAAEADGLPSHGVSRVPFYAAQARAGKVDGQARPSLTQPRTGAVRVDARDGFAFPAIRLGIERALELLGTAGVVGVSIANSHHSGAGGYHVEACAMRGALCIGFSNSPAGIAPHGGRLGSFGTNPIAFACPRANGSPLVIDLSLSTVARGKVMLAAKRGEAIPDDWALDKSGRPTTSPEAALAGTMTPIAGAKGSALALMVEILTACLGASSLAFEASSFFDAEGPPPRIAQSFVLIDPDALADGAFAERLETLLAHVVAQDGARLPGVRRLESRARARSEGVLIPAPLRAELARIAAGADR